MKKVDLSSNSVFRFGMSLSVTPPLWPRRIAANGPSQVLSQLSTRPYAGRLNFPEYLVRIQRPSAAVRVIVFTSNTHFSSKFKNLTFVHLFPMEVGGEHSCTFFILPFLGLILCNIIFITISSF